MLNAFYSYNENKMGKDLTRKLRRVCPEVYSTFYFAYIEYFCFSVYFSGNVTGSGFFVFLFGS